jgi:hypothetical protein
MAESDGSFKLPRMKRPRVGRAPKIARVPDMLGGRKARKGRKGRVG